MLSLVGKKEENPLPIHSKKKFQTPKGDQKLRIIGGQWRGRQLGFPQVDGLRPTGNRIRETLFNWLQAEIPGSLCLDAFAGSGALGIEALSRGAAHCDFFETAPKAASQLKENLGILETRDLAFVGGNVLQHLENTGSPPYDVLFLDPPFALDLWPACIDKLENNNWLRCGSFIYIECPEDHRLITPSSWHSHRSKTAGNIRYSLYLKS